jgi:PIN domain nuclease of toxin-antitoxin system
LRLLLDTCTFLWAVSATDELSTLAAKLLADPDNDVYLSAVSAWEIAVKHANGRLVLAEQAHSFVPRNRVAHGFLELSLDEESALHVGRLPSAHRDPFDRMLVCQAISHGLTIVTPDAQIALYPVRTIW